MKKALKHLTVSDKILGAHITEVGPFKLTVERAPTPFYSLAQSIAYQQLTGKAAATIWGRVVDLHGGNRFITSKRVLTTKPADLRSAGLSHAKITSLIDLAQHAEQKIIPGWTALEKLSDEEIIERITQVKGIGPWTVQMMLIFSMGRLDVCPSTDYGVQKGFSVLLNNGELPKPRALLEYAERWRPYRSVAAWYLWRAADMQKAKPSAGRG